MATKVVMEALSPTMEEGRLIAWLKKQGDTVKSGDTLAEVETDKAVMELVARGDGVVREVLRSGPLEPDTSLRQFALSTAALTLAVTAVFVPPLFPFAAAATAIVSAHIFVSASNAIFVERKIKVDVLDAIVIALSLGFGHVIAAAIMVWVVDASNYLLKSSSVESRKLLTKVFGKQTRKAWTSGWIGRGFRFELPWQDGFRSPCSRAFAASRCSPSSGTRQIVKPSVLVVSKPVSSTVAVGFGDRAWNRDLECGRGLGPF